VLLGARADRERDRAEQSVLREQAAQAQGHFERGRNAWLAGDVQTAVREVSEALANGHDSLAARVVIGNALASLRASIAVMRGHTGQVSTIDVSPDERVIATGSADRTVRLWDATTGAPLRALHHTEHVWRVRFSPDGKQLLACGYEGSAAVWNLAAGTAITLVKSQGIIQDCRFIARGSRVVTAARSGEIRVSDPQTGEPIGPLLAHKESVEFMLADELPGGDLVTATDTEPIIRIWDRAGHPVGELTARADVGRAALGHDGVLVTADRDRHGLQFWSIPERRLIGELVAHKARIIALRFSPDGRRLLSVSSDGEARVWDTTTRRLVAALVGAPNAQDGRFSRDGELVVIASNDGARVFSASTGRLRARLDGHTSVVWTAAFAGDRLVTASWDHTAQLWRVGDGIELAEHAIGDVSERDELLAFDAARDRVGVGVPGAAVVIDARSGRVLRKLAVAADDVPVSIAFTGSGVATLTAGGELILFAPDGHRVSARRLDARRETRRRLELAPDRMRLVAATRLGAVVVLRLPDLEPIQTLLTEGTGQIERDSVVAWDRSGLVAAANAHGEVTVWSSDLQPLSKTAIGSAFAFGPPGLAIGGDGTLALVDPRTGVRRQTWSGHMNTIGALSWIGKELVSGGADGTLRRWNPQQPEPLVVMRGHTGGVVGTDVAPDARLVASGGLDGTVRVWDLASGVEVLRIAAHADGNTPGVDAVRWLGRDRLGSTGGDGTFRIWRILVDDRPVSTIVGEARCLLGRWDAVWKPTLDCSLTATPRSK
jgi:WD40 repeat protein